MPNTWRHRSGAVVIGLLALVGVSLAGCTNGAHDAGAGGSHAGGAPTTPAAPPVSLTITPASTAGDISPATPIVVTAANGKVGTVTVTDTANGATVAGTTSADGRTWTSSGQLAYDATYQVTATGTNTAGRTARQAATLHTVAPGTLVYPSLVPAPAAGNDFGVGEVVEVLFDHPVTDRAAAEKALTVTSTPAQPGGWYWMSSKEVHYRPENLWQPGTTVTVNIGLYGVNLGGGAYGKASRTLSFHIHDSWVATADGNTKQMTIAHNGTVVKTMPISMGRASLPTHTGTHVITEKSPVVNMNSCTYGVCSGPNSYNETVYLDERISNSGEFVHAAPWSVGSQGSSNVSHGCINLSNANAQWFYDTFGPGDIVNVVNSGGPPLPVWDTGDWALSWAQWQAGSALSS